MERVCFTQRRKEDAKAQKEVPLCAFASSLRLCVKQTLSIVRKK